MSREMMSMEMKGANALMKKMDALAASGNLTKAFKTSEFVTLAEARKRLDRYLSQYMGIPNQNIKGLTPMYIKVIGFKNNVVTSAMGIGKRTGFNLSIYPHKDYKRRSGDWGVRVQGGKRNPYQGEYEKGFELKGHWKVSKYVYTDALLMRFDDDLKAEYLETENPAQMLNNSGNKDAFLDYVRQRAVVNLKRQVNFMTSGIKKKAAGNA
jgi:hypothetical protein